MGAELKAIGAGMKGGLKAAFAMICPPQCLCCGAVVAATGALCPRCWPATPFISGKVCDSCGIPLGDDGRDEAAHCDECSAAPPPWSRGRAALLYRDNGRRLVLSLKHADRLDTAPALAGWLARAALPLMDKGVIIAPMPLSRRRLLQRRANQAAELARAMTALPAMRSYSPVFVPGLLRRVRHTPSQEGRTREERFANLSGAIEAAPERRDSLAGRHVLIVDDVMTSGASFAAATQACLAAGAARVDVVALARVARDA